MCGILGFNWNDLKLAKKLGESIKHRENFFNSKLLCFDKSRVNKKVIKIEYRNKING